MIDVDGLTWLVAFVPSQSWANAQLALQRRGLVAFVPVATRMVASKHMRRRRIRRVFAVAPGYLFVGCRDVGDGLVRLAGAEFVRGLMVVAGQDRPVVLTGRDIRALNAALVELVGEAGQGNEARPMPVRVGSRARVISGAGGGLEVDVREVFPSRRAARVAMTMLGSERLVEMPVDALRELQ